MTGLNSSFSWPAAASSFSPSTLGPWSRFVRRMLRRQLYSFPKTMLRATRQLISGSSAQRYWARRSRTFPLFSPDTRARNRPRGEQKDRAIPRLAQAPMRAGEAPA